ncbi:restriction endonuclease subunit S [Lactobacillus delbrueckii subsp. lactis]|uniref:restriction endonuclease subunit S n=1 Tax=Lactobacillus delbrueckii TaxID=1584 RepID=UPI001E405BF2|nr:restriction endonuclease subunit S [Lactobacillus delbrueckii]MCD5547314.1 restriction endonuclease subunit S [Lactobacillus delbrueckii subsp. lactis]
MYDNSFTSFFGRINDNLLELTSNAVKDFVDSHNNMRRTNIYHYCDIQYGAPYKSKLFNDKAVGLPLIRIRDLRSGEPLYYTEEITGRDIIVNTGDLLIGMDAEFRPALWKGSKSKLNQRVLKVVPKKEITNIFLLNILNPYMLFLENSKTGTTVIHLGKKDLDSISLPLFSENDLIEFNKKLLPQNLYISNLFEETRKLDKLKNILVREYF